MLLVRKLVCSAADIPFLADAQTPSGTRRYFARAACMLDIGGTSMADATRKHNIILMTVWMETPRGREAGSQWRAAGALEAQISSKLVWKKVLLTRTWLLRKKIACRFDHSTVPMLHNAMEAMRKWGHGEPR